MRERAADNGMDLIFAELAREFDDPTDSELTVSQPPEFADSLVDEALSGRHRGTGEADESGSTGPEKSVSDSGGRHADPRS